MLRRRAHRHNERVRASQHAAVAELAQLALEGTRLDHLTDAAAAAVARELAADQVAVLELTRDGRGLLARAGVGLPDGVLGGVLPVDPVPAGRRPWQRQLALGRGRRVRDDRGAQRRARSLHHRRLRLPPGRRQRARRGGRADRPRGPRARQRGAVPRAGRHDARPHVDDRRRGRRDLREQGVAALHRRAVGRRCDVRSDRPSRRPRGGGPAVGGGLEQARGVPPRVPAAPRPRRADTAGCSRWGCRASRAASSWATSAPPPISTSAARWRRRSESPRRASATWRTPRRQ